MGDAKKKSDEEFLTWAEELGDPGGTMLAAGHAKPRASDSAVRAARRMVGGLGASERAVVELALRLDRFKRAVRGSNGEPKAKRKVS